MVPPQLTKVLSIMYVDAAIILCQVILLNGVHCICSGLSLLPIGKISFVVSMMLCVCNVAGIRPTSKHDPWRCGGNCHNGGNRRGNI